MLYAARVPKRMNQYSNYINVPICNSYHDAVKCIVITHNGRFKMPSANLLKTSHKLSR